MKIIVTGFHASSFNTHRPEINTPWSCEESAGLEFVLIKNTEEILSRPRGIGAAGRDWLIQINIAVANLDVEPARRIYTNPCLVMDRSPLAAIIRERNKTPSFTVQTFGHRRIRH